MCDEHGGPITISDSTSSPVESYEILDDGPDAKKGRMIEDLGNGTIEAKTLSDTDTGYKSKINAEDPPSHEPKQTFGPRISAGIDYTG